MSKEIVRIRICSIINDFCEKEEKCEDCSLKHISDNIEHYAKLHEENRLIELPCKVGSRVYFITKTNEILDTTLDDLNTCYEFRNLIGTGFYLTKEEAKKALAELKGGEA